MPRKPHSSKTSSASSTGSFATTPDLSSMGDMSTPPDTTAEPRGVGLSDPVHSADRRKILEIIDRMRATG